MTAYCSADQWPMLGPWSLPEYVSGVAKQTLPSLGTEAEAVNKTTEALAPVGSISQGREDELETKRATGPLPVS